MAYLKKKINFIFLETINNRDICKNELQLLLLILLN